MDQQSFRYYIPGIIFLTPIYIVACWITINYFTDSDIRIFVLVGGITVFPAIAWPFGWFLYHSYTVLRLSITGGRYEDKEFVKLVKEETKPFYNSHENKIIIDFTHVPEIGQWLNLEPEVFRRIFYPQFSSRKFFTSIRTVGINTPYNEQYADLVTMNYIGRPYLKSISSIRYGLESGIYTFILGLTYSLSFYFIWNYHIKIDINIVVYITSIIITLILTILILTTLIKSWGQADKEYDSRLILHVVSALNSHHINIDSLYKSLPENLLNKLNGIELNNTKAAVFQIDNFLLNENSEEILMNWLTVNKKNVDIDTKNHLIDKQINVLEDYDKFYFLLKKIKKNILSIEIRRLIAYTKENVSTNNNKFKSSNPSENSLALISFLKSKGVEIILVSLCDKSIVEIFCWEYFGIPSSQVIAPLKFNNSHRHYDLAKSVSYVEAEFKKTIKKKHKRPIIIGCLGTWDKFLLDELDKDGFIIINPDKHSLKNKLPKTIINQERILKI